jgi:medium-chain acyl-[acyl-carrier-protein] hydrolase
VVLYFCPEKILACQGKTIVKKEPLSPWIQYQLPKSATRLRLFCFPYAGGSAAIFRLWSELLPPQIEVWPVQLPGRERRLSEKPFERLDALVAALVEVLRPYLNEPYAFFGHSMGALISFELTRALRKTGFTAGPTRLCVSAHRAPQLPNLLPIVYNLPDQQFIEELQRLKGTPKEVLQHPELLELLLPMVRADFAVCETYTYARQAPLTCPISAYGGLNDEEIPRASIAAWREQTRGPFNLSFFDGGHFFIKEQQAALLRTLARDLLL